MLDYHMLLRSRFGLARPCIIIGNVCIRYRELTSVQEKHAQVIVARRTTCEFITPLQDMTDEAVRREVDNLNTLFPVLRDEEPVLQPHVDKIRAICPIDG